MAVVRVDDFADANWSVVPGSVFNKRLMRFDPAMYGFDAVPFPVDEWAQRSELHYLYNRMITGELLDERDPRDNSPLYPLRINLWDFICTIHAYMATGIEDDAKPNIVFQSGNSPHKRSRAPRYTEWVAQALNNSAIDWFSLFYGMNAYGAMALVMRYDQDSQTSPVWFEMIGAPNFYPVLDSAGRVIAFFIARQISNAEAKFRYGVTVDSSTIPTYIEYWDPNRFEVRINDMPAYYQDGETLIRGENPFGFAPAVYIPHLRKRSLYGDSQLWRTDELVKEFNARIADVSDSVADDADTSFWGYNIDKTKVQKVGGKKVVSLGRYLDGKLSPTIEAFSSGHAIRDGVEFIDSLWNLILRMNDIPQVALGVDEGSQRSSLTLRSRFWMLESHSHVERNNASGQLIRLAHMVIRAMAVLGYPAPKGGDDLAVTVTWPRMLPQDRAELVNEMVQRKAASLISRQKAIELFGDVEDIPEELKRIDEDAARDVKLEAMLKSLSSSGGNNGTSNEER